MKTNLFKLCCLSAIMLNVCANTMMAQNISQYVIPTAGGYHTSTIGTLSFTIGETNTQTLQVGNHMLTQGFQQPFKAILNLKMYLQGYYTGGGFMQNVLFNEGVTMAPGNQCDTIMIELRQSSPPYTVVSSSTSVLQTNGTVQFGGNAALGQLYYIVIKHRNTIESWSSNPVMIQENTLYDFSVGANKVYGNNQTEVATGVWALYSGDINRDENIDLLDLGFIEDDINNFLFGYYATDINGDGNIDLLDNPTVESNINSFIYTIKP